MRLLAQHPHGRAGLNYNLELRWDGPAVCIDDRGLDTTLPQDLVIGTSGDDLAILDGKRLDKCWNTVGGDLRIVDDAIGRHEGLPFHTTRGPHPCGPRVSDRYLCFAAPGMKYSGNVVAAAPCTIV